MSEGAFARRILRSGDRISPADTVTLDYEGRFLRRRRLTTDSGASIVVDLPETVSLQDGDALETMDGRHAVVRAAKEELIEIRASGAEIGRLAWHIGNRHTPAQIVDDRILIRHDHVLAEMLTRLGARTAIIFAPFTPEGGAYGHGRTLGHDHGHGHGHGHDQGNARTHARSPDKNHPHNEPFGGAARTGRI